MTFREGQPIYIQIAERLMDEIAAGLYKADERVPGVREYSALLQVNVNTTVKAFDVLAMHGIIYNKRGLGSFVAADATEIIRTQRRADFFERQIPQIVRQLSQLDISIDELVERLKSNSNQNTTNQSI